MKILLAFAVIVISGPVTCPWVDNMGDLAPRAQVIADKNKAITDFDELYGQVNGDFPGIQLDPQENPYGEFVAVYFFHCNDPQPPIPFGLHGVWPAFKNKNTQYVDCAGVNQVNNRLKQNLKEFLRLIHNQQNQQVQCVINLQPVFGRNQIRSYCTSKTDDGITDTVDQLVDEFMKHGTCQTWREEEFLAYNGGIQGLTDDITNCLTNFANENDPEGITAENFIFIVKHMARYSIAEKKIINGFGFQVPNNMNCNPPQNNINPLPNFNLEGVTFVYSQRYGDNNCCAQEFKGFRRLDGYDRVI